MHTPQTRYTAKQKMLRLRQEWLEENGPCVKCGSKDRLEVDHINPAEKISHTVWSWAPARRATELDKCQVLCHDCHLEKTRKDYLESSPRVHGTWQSYKRTQAPCRCELCRAANTEYIRQRRMSMTHLKVVSDTGSTPVWSTDVIANSAMRGPVMVSTGQYGE